MSGGPEGYDELDDAIDAALGMIDATATVDGRRWSCQLRIISVIRRHQRRDELGWAWLSYADLAKQAHVSINTVRKLLGTKSHQGAMWRTLWIVERGPTGIGQRPSAWRLIHPSHWRRVAWLERDRELRAARLGFISHDRDEPTEGAQTVNGRGDPQRVVAGHRPTGQRAANSGVSRLAGHSPTGNRATTKSSAARFGTGNRAANREIDGVSPSSRRSKDLLLLQQLQEEEEFAIAQRLIEAIETKASAVMFSNELKARCRRATKRMDVDALIQAVAAAPTQLGIPKLVEWVERVASGQTHLLARPTADRPPDDPDVVELARLEHEVAIARSNGWDVESLLLEMQECQNRVQRREESQG